jgi:hypothetical protein
MASLPQRGGTLGSDVFTVMQERPALASCLLAVPLGAILAAWQTRSFPQRQTMR